MILTRVTTYNGGYHAYTFNCTYNYTYTCIEEGILAGMAQHGKVLKAELTNIPSSIQWSKILLASSVSAATLGKGDSNRLVYNYGFFFHFFLKKGRVAILQSQFSCYGESMKSGNLNFV